MESLDDFKQLLADDRQRIKLFDFIDQQCSEAIAQLSSNEMKHPPQMDEESFTSYLDIVHDVISELQDIMALLGFWGSSNHHRLVTLHTRQFCQWLTTPASQHIGNSLKWYPLLIQIYSLGLGAISSGSLDLLHTFMRSPYPDPTSRRLRVPLIIAIYSGLSNAERLFRMLPNRQRQFTPISEHLFEYFKTALEDVIFFGGDYEFIFDRFEILLSLEYSHINEQIHERRFWAPTGRFGWKFLRRAGPDPYSDLIQDAAHAEDRWPPIMAGFFGRDYQRYEEVVTNYTERLQQLPWH